MPQFDKVTFFNQIFWVLLVFFSFYFVLLKQILPSLLMSVKTRKKAVKSYLAASTKASEASTSSVDSPFSN